MTHSNLTQSFFTQKLIIILSDETVPGEHVGASDAGSFWALDGHVVEISKADAVVGGGQKAVAEPIVER